MEQEEVLRLLKNALEVAETHNEIYSMSMIMYIIKFLEVSYE